MHSVLAVFKECLPSHKACLFNIAYKHTGTTLHNLHIRSAVLDGLPKGDTLLHIKQLNSHSHSDGLISINSSDSEPTCKSEKLQSQVLSSNSLPPVPATLIKGSNKVYSSRWQSFHQDTLTQLNSLQGINMDHASNSLKFWTLWNGYSVSEFMWLLFLARSLNVSLI